MRRLSRSEGAAAVVGGALLGGGGGGEPGGGEALVEMAFAAGEVWLADTEDLPGTGIVVTAALVGAPSAPAARVRPADYWWSFEVLCRRSAAEEEAPVVAVITNENGGEATVNGWYQAARAGLPVLDCPGNGRAHPTGVMGSLNLDLLPGYRSIQACAGGGGPGGDHGLRLVVEGPLASCASLIRGASVEAGGLVAVARNPVPVDHVKANGARGAISQAIALGEGMLAEDKPLSRIAAACRLLGPGAQLIEARLEDVSLASRGGFDVGAVRLVDAGGMRLRLDFWNEYAIAEICGEVLAVFPDLIATVDLETGFSVSTAAVAGMEEGHPLGVLLAPRGLLRLGATMTRSDLLGHVAGALGRDSLPVRARTSPQ